jgi:hypothetical protein
MLDMSTSLFLENYSFMILKPTSLFFAHAFMHFVCALLCIHGNIMSNNVRFIDFRSQAMRFRFQRMFHIACQVRHVTAKGPNP